MKPVELYEMSGFMETPVLWGDSPKYAAGSGYHCGVTACTVPVGLWYST